jgi:hypothetical protein
VRGCVAGCRSLCADEIASGLGEERPVSRVGPVRQRSDLEVGELGVLVALSFLHFFEFLEVMGFE